MVLLVADRHDNIGMDRVARAVGDAAGAEAVFDAGDDTSTGSTWEAFSLDSLDAAFDDGPYADSKWAVDRQPRPRPLRRRLPRRPRLDRARRRGGRRPGRDPAARRRRPPSSGLGSWRDESGLSFDEVADRLADAACEADEDGDRISTILVHDANMGDEALGPRLHRPGRRRPPPRPERPDRDDRRERRGRLQLHDRHHRRRGVRHRGRRRDPPSGRHHRCSPTATAVRSASSRSLSTPNGGFTVGDYVELDPSEG